MGRHYSISYLRRLMAVVADVERPKIAEYRPDVEYYKDSRQWVVTLVSIDEEEEDLSIRFRD